VPPLFRAEVASALPLNLFNLRVESSLPAQEDALLLRTYNLGLMTLPCRDRSVFGPATLASATRASVIIPLMVRPERRVVLAGESPVRVSSGAPGSRLQSGGEIRSSRAECRKPFKKEGSKPAGRNKQ